MSIKIRFSGKGLKILLGSVSFAIIFSTICFDKKHAITVCNYTGRDIVVYQDIECLVSGRPKYRSAVIGSYILIKDSTCDRFINILSECNLEWWDRKLEECDSFWIIFFLSKRTDMFVYNRAVVRRNSYDSIIITKDTIERILPECKLVIKK